MTDAPNWSAVVTYRTDAGPMVIARTMAELDELYDVIERGPHFDTVMDIHITRINHCTSPTLTVEQAEQM